MACCLGLVGMSCPAHVRYHGVLPMPSKSCPIPVRFHSMLLTGLVDTSYLVSVRIGPVALIALCGGTSGTRCLNHTFLHDMLPRPDGYGLSCLCSHLTRRPHSILTKTYWLWVVPPCSPSRCVAQACWVRFVPGVRKSVIAVQRW